VKEITKIKVQTICIFEIPVYLCIPILEKVQIKSRIFAEFFLEMLYVIGE